MHAGTHSHRLRHARTHTHTHTHVHIPQVLLAEWDMGHLTEMGNAYVRSKLFEAYQVGGGRGSSRSQDLRHVSARGLYLCFAYPGAHINTFVHM